MFTSLLEVFPNVSQLRIDSIPAEERARCTDAIAHMTAFVKSVDPEFKRDTTSCYINYRGFDFKTSGEAHRHYVMKSKSMEERSERFDIPGEESDDFYFPRSDAGYLRYKLGDDITLHIRAEAFYTFRDGEYTRTKRDVVTSETPIKMTMLQFVYECPKYPELHKFGYSPAGYWDEDMNDCYVQPGEGYGPRLTIIEMKNDLECLRKAEVLNDE